MHVTSRSYLTAGVAALGVGAIALSPIQPLPAQTAMAPQRAVSTMAVELAATLNPIAANLEAWNNALGTAVENATRLNDAWTASTFPIFQTILTNQLVYAQEFPRIGVIAKQIFENIGNAFAAPLVEGANNISTTLTAPLKAGPVTVTTLSQRDLYGVLLSPLSPLPASLAPVIEFMSTPFAGAVLAGIGPVIGTTLAITNSIKATFAALGARDLPGALTEFLNLAPNAVIAFLNGGQILDLTKIVNNISPLPPEVTRIGLNMGGLVSSGLSPIEGQPSKEVSGSMFDGLSADASLSGLSLSDPGLSVGPIGATQLLTKRIAEAIKVTPPPTAAAAPAAAAVAAPVAIEAAAEVAAVADEAPAPKQSRAAKADSGKSNTGRADRGARRGA